MKRNTKIAAAALLVFLLIGFLVAFHMANSAPVYEGRNTDLVELYENPSSYNNKNADSAAAIIVNENNEKTAADNVVYSVVFNFRGYDTIGESIILFAAITGTMVILGRASDEHKKKEEPGE